ncbi:transcriptional regulator [Actinorhabdospora filicis]|uniref:Transcriptional regulator n=1 Tax=Actinorhabdospora filicis TaxID=1785913 RepID=A0A9W6SMJ2_9ACTN|nr:transcriptional regulator [Actinorhabdospora filicis]
MVLLRRIIGEALRNRRRAQKRTLRDVSTAANVSLGYLSEIERGHKEASSELLAAICHALDTRLSDVLGEVSRTVAGVEDAQRLDKLREVRRARLSPVRSDAIVTALRPRNAATRVTHPPQRRERHASPEARVAA